jgi:two-component system, NtrC family, response regulator
MASGPRVTAKDLELEHVRKMAAPSATTLREARERVEREVVEQALKRNAGRITTAAADLGISRPTLYELMEKLGIPKERAATNVN